MLISTSRTEYLKDSYLLTDIYENPVCASHTLDAVILVPDILCSFLKNINASNKTLYLGSLKKYKLYQSI